MSEVDRNRAGDRWIPVPLPPPDTFANPFSAAPDHLKEPTAAQCFARKAVYRPPCRTSQIVLRLGDVLQSCRLRWFATQVGSGCGRDTFGVGKIEFFGTFRMLSVSGVFKPRA